MKKFCDKETNLKDEHIDLEHLREVQSEINEIKRLLDTQPNFDNHIKGYSFNNHHSVSISNFNDIANYVVDVIFGKADPNKIPWEIINHRTTSPELFWKTIESYSHDMAIYTGDNYEKKRRLNQLILLEEELKKSLGIY